jgi:phosphatidylinositol alpha-1,6-mannosyltransferase
MNILICTSEFPPDPGGIGNHAFGLFQSFRKLKFSVDVISNSRNFNLEKIWLADNNIFNCVKYVKRYKFSFYTYLLRFYFFIKRLYFSKNSERPNVIYFSGKFSIWILSLVKIPDNIQTYVIIHGSEIRQNNHFSEYLFNLSFKKCDKIILVSKFTKMKLLQNYSYLDTSKLHVINNGFILPDFDIRRSLNETLTFITVGNITKRKGQINFIKTLPKISQKYSNSVYNLIGLPTDLNSILSISKQLEITKNICYLGVLSEKEKWSNLCNSHIFIMLSNELNNGDFEGFGIAILEANYCSVPAIGTKLSGISDAIIDRYNGILVDPNNEDEIFEAIIEIINNYDSYSKHAKLHAASFTWNSKIHDYLGLIKGYNILH